MTRKYQVNLIHSEEGVSVSCPALPGCYSQGTSVPDALSNIADAMRDYLELWGDPQVGFETREVEVTVERLGDQPQE
jgi:predicted RNase H-like HicB family nuclease